MQLLCYRLRLWSVHIIGALRARTLLRLPAHCRLNGLCKSCRALPSKGSSCKLSGLLWQQLGVCSGGLLRVNECVKAARHRHQCRLVH